MIAPDLAEWQRLYAAEDAYVALAPWKWMTEADLFGVRSPESAEIGWCAVVGAYGETRGLAVYLGDEGLEMYSAAQLGALDTAIIGNNFPALWYSLGGRRDLKPRELEVIRALGLRFRGRDVWPCFRSYRPGYAPWPLETHEARFLALALEQTTLVARRLGRVGSDLGDGDRRLVRIADDDGIYSDRMVDLAVPPHEPPPPHDELRVARIRNRCGHDTRTWFCIHAYTEHEIRKRGRRTCYESVFLITRDDGCATILYDTEGEPPLTAQQTQHEFLTALEKTGRIPAGLRVSTEPPLRALRPIAEDLGIDCRLSTHGLVLSEARAGLADFLAGRG